MKDNTKKTLKIYWQATLKYKLTFLACMLGVTVAVALDSVTPLYLKDFFNLLSSNQSAGAISSGLIGILLIILAINMIKWIGWRVASFTSNYYFSNVIADLSNKCFAYLHRHSYSYFIDNFQGTLTKRVKWFTGAFETLSDQALWHLWPLTIQIILSLVILSRINVYFGLGLGVWIVIFLTVNWFFTKFKLKYDIQRSEAESSNSGLLADTVANHNNVKLFNGYEGELERFAESTSALRKLRKWSWDLGDIFASVQGLFSVILEFGLFFFAVILWGRGIVTVGDFVLIQSLILTLFMRIWDFGNFIRRIYSSLADAEEMTIVFNTPHEIKDIPNAKPLVIKQGKVEFKNVGFNYHETRAVLKKLNLIIAPREKVAIIGPSGAGKTTIVKLLFRMHDVSAGHILIDGQDVGKVTLESLWQNVSLVPQDPILFHRSLMDNIRYGRPEATEEEVIEAAKLAHCHEFISNLDKGYETFVGERGVKLSGGERQRVAIARAILKNAPILVLDEATSSLDSESESLIQEALSELMKNKTVVVIAHRLSTIRKMDRIIVVDQGGIAEEGTHEELLASGEGSIYGKLWRLQAGGFTGELSS